MGEVRFMISEAAKQVDVESHVLRYWEEELSLTIGRTEMGHRYYTKDDIQLFRCIKKLKDEGMLLRDLKPLIPELQETRLKLKKEEKQTVESKNLPEQAPVSASTSVSPSAGEVMIPFEKIEQVRALVGTVFREALLENNEIIKNDIGSRITADVIHEVDYLFQARERQQEEHFRKLDSLIRQQQATRRESAKNGPVMKLRKIFT